MDLSELLPNASRKKRMKDTEYLLYIILVEWGWSWSQLKSTPLPIVIRTLKVFKEQKEKEVKAQKKSRRKK